MARDEFGNFIKMSRVILVTDLRRDDPTSAQAETRHRSGADFLDPETKQASPAAKFQRFDGNRHSLVSTGPIRHYFDPLIDSNRMSQSRVGNDDRA